MVPAMSLMAVMITVGKSMGSLAYKKVKLQFVSHCILVVMEDISPTIILGNSVITAMLLVALPIASSSLAGVVLM